MRRPAMLLYSPILHGYRRLDKWVVAGLMTARHT